MERGESLGQEGGKKQGCSDRDLIAGCCDQSEEIFDRSGADGCHPEAADVGIARLEAVTHRQCHYFEFPPRGGGP